jgi:hypothetical protein
MIVLQLLMVQDRQHLNDGELEEGHELWDLVNKGLAAAMKATFTLLLGNCWFCIPW